MEKKINKSSISAKNKAMLHETPWDSRFIVKKLPNYDSKRDVYSKCIQNNRLRLRSHRPSGARSNSNSSSSRSRTLSKDSLNKTARTRQIYDGQAKLLESQLKETWERFRVSPQHMDIFSTQIAHLPSKRKAFVIAKEIDLLEKGENPVQLVMNSITDREYLVIQISELNQSLLATTEKQKVASLKKEAIELFRNIRNLNLSIVESVNFWSNYMKLNAYEFLWKNENYLEKMKHDLNFLKDTALAGLFKFEEDDPFLVNLKVASIATRANRTNRIQYVPIFPLNPKVSEKVNFGMKVLGLVQRKPSPYIKVKNSKPPKPETRVTPKQEESTPECHQVVSDLEEEKQPELSLGEIKAISEDVLGELLDSETRGNITNYVEESIKEMISASMRLYSSSILDRIITETLKEQIPFVANDAYTEIKDQEYLGSWEEVITQVTQEELSNLVEEEFRGITCLHAYEYMISSLSMQSIVEESLSEEKSQNSRIVVIVLEELVDCFLKKDWLEELVEEELTCFRIDESRKDLPAPIQREIFVLEKDRIFFRVAEWVWFDIVKDFPGRLWLEALVSSVLNQEKGLECEETFVLADPEVEIEETKRSKSTRSNLLYQRK